MQKTLFRKNALQKVLSPMELDRSLIIVSKKSWLALLSLGLLIVLIIYWGFFGKIHERITASGIIITKQGIYSAYAPAGGIIVSMNVSVGDYVQYGDLIATILIPKERSEIKSLIDKIERKKTKIDQIAAFNASLDHSNLTQKTQIQESLNTTIGLLKEQIAWNDKFLETLRKLLSRGATSEKDFADFRAERDRVTMNLVEKITELKKAENEYLKQKKEINHEELELYLELVALTEELAEKNNLYRTNSQIISSGTGLVTSVLVERGMIVDANQPVVNINDTSESHADNWVLYAYFSLYNSGKIEAGMPVLVTPSMVKAEREGSILGVVHSVNNYVQSAEALNLKYRNKNFSDAIFQMNNNMPVEVKIMLTNNSENFSGFEWTNGSGPRIKIPEGAYCSASIAVETLRPIDIVFSKFRKDLFGIGVNEEVMQEKVKNILN